MCVRACCRDVDGLKSLTVSDIQDAPVGLAELAQMLIVVEVPSGSLSLSVSGRTTPAFLTPRSPHCQAQNAEKPAGVSNAAFTSLYTTSHWNALQATHPIMRARRSPPPPSSPSPPPILRVVRFAFPVRECCGVFRSIVCRALSSWFAKWLEIAAAACCHLPSTRPSHDV
jgi:hypothetical protein